MAIAWAVLLPIATLLASRPATGRAGAALAFVVYAIGSLICHQRPERSYHLFAVQMPVCARCTGVYAGAALASMVMAVRAFATVSGGGTVATASRARHRGGVVGAALTGGRTTRVLIASLVPGIATLLYEAISGQTPSNMIRALSGVPIGAAVAWIVWSAASATPEGM